MTCIDKLDAYCIILCIYFICGYQRNNGTAFVKIETQDIHFLRLRSDYTVSENDSFIMNWTNTEKGTDETVILSLP